MDVIETIKLTIAAATPITVLIAGWMIKQREQINAELVKKRIALYDSLAPLANDIFCFYVWRGHWQDLDPDRIIANKRAIDRIMHHYRHFWGAPTWHAYDAFMATCFDTYQGIGAAARLRIDTAHATLMIGQAWKPEWDARIATRKPPPTVAQIEAAYDAWMGALAADIGALRR